MEVHIPRTAVSTACAAVCRTVADGEGDPLVVRETEAAPAAKARLERPRAREAAAMTGIAALAIIPVRVQSQRLPREALLQESGRELFLHTCEQAKKARNIDRVVVATDDAEAPSTARSRRARTVTAPMARRRSANATAIASNWTTPTGRSSRHKGS
jgi:hypothetical protein